MVKLKKEDLLQTEKVLYNLIRYHIDLYKRNYLVKRLLMEAGANIKIKSELAFLDYFFVQR